MGVVRSGGGRPDKGERWSDEAAGAGGVVRTSGAAASLCK